MKKNPRVKKKRVSIGKTKVVPGDKTISVHITGSAMRGSTGYDLSRLVKALRCFEEITKKTYLFINDKNRMSEFDKENFKIIIYDIKEGSFLAQLKLQIQNYAIPLYPFFAEHAGSIWEAIKNTYQYLKLLIDTRKKGERAQMEINGDGNICITTGDNSPVYVFPPYVHKLGQQLTPIFSELSKVIDGREIESIGFGDNDADEIKMTQEDKERFREKIYLIDDEILLSGIITVSNAKSYTGKIDIQENENGIVPGTYNFTLSSELQNAEFMKSSFMNSQRYICSPKVKLDPGKGLEETIVELKILRKVI